MDLASLLLKLIPLLLICFIGPGVLIMKPMRCSPVERLCGVFAVSFLAVYLASFALFCLNLGEWAYWVVSGLFALMGLAGWETARLLIRRRSSRGVLLAFAIVLGWELLHLTMVKHFDGGNVGGDWHEQFARTTFFLHLLPKETLFLNRWPLTARPPMMNLLAAFFCRQAGIQFVTFSLVYLVLNGWAFVPCCLLLRMVVPRSRKLTGILAILFMLNPTIVQNATFTWTKALTAGLVVLGVSLYVRGLRRGSRGDWRIPAAAIVLAEAILCHYSAGPFALAVALHFSALVFLGRRPVSQWLVSAAGAALLLGTWFGWTSIEFHSSRGFTDASDTTGMGDFSFAQNLGRMLYNLFASIVPHPLHPGGELRYESLDSLAHVRNYFFSITQTTLPAMIGLSGGVIAVWLLLRYPMRPRGFWYFYIPFGFVAGLAVNPLWSRYGCANVTLQSMGMMGLVWLAAWTRRLPRMAFRLLCVGVAIDYVWGILLQFYCENLPYRIATMPNGTIRYLIFVGNSPIPAMSYGDVLRTHYLLLGDYVPNAGGFLMACSALVAAGAMARLIQVRAG